MGPDMILHLSLTLLPQKSTFNKHYKECVIIQYRAVMVYINDTCRPLFDTGISHCIYKGCVMIKYREQLLCISTVHVFHHVLHKSLCIQRACLYIRQGTSTLYIHDIKFITGSSYYVDTMYAII
jgi:hypothetical protein